MNSCLILNKLAILVTFILTSAKIVNILWLFTDKMLTNLRDCLLMCLFYHINSCFVNFCSKDQIIQPASETMDLHIR